MVTNESWSVDLNCHTLANLTIKFFTLAHLPLHLLSSATTLIPRYYFFASWRYPLASCSLRGFCLAQIKPTVKTQLPSFSKIARDNSLYPTFWYLSNPSWKRNILVIHTWLETASLIKHERQQLAKTRNHCRSKPLRCCQSRFPLSINVSPSVFIKARTMIESFQLKQRKLAFILRNLKIATSFLSHRQPSECLLALLNNIKPYWSLLSPNCPSTASHLFYPSCTVQYVGPACSLSGPIDSEGD